MAVIVAKGPNDNQVYFTIDQSLVKVPETKVLELIRDIDKMALPTGDNSQGSLYIIGSDDPEVVQDIINKGKAKGRYITGKIWVHPDLTVIRTKIIAVLNGEKERLTDKIQIIKR